MEDKQKKIYFVDIDETVFHTTALVYVVENENIKKTLDNTEFNTYELKSGEKYSFVEFQNAKKFYDESRPIESVIRKVSKHILNNERVVFLTARSTPDDKVLFDETFKKYDMNIGNENVSFEFVGDKVGSVNENKKQVISEYLKESLYDKITMYDDCIKNLDSFLELDIGLKQKFKAYTVRDEKLEKYR